MHVSAKAEYALRALLELAARDPEPATLREIVTEQNLPHSFAEKILPGLRRAGFVRVSRAGYALARPPDQITVGAVLLAVDGPTVTVHGLSPETITYVGAARGLSALWLAASSSLSNLIGAVTLQHLIAEAGRAAVVALPSPSQPAELPRRDAPQRWRKGS